MMQAQTRPAARLRVLVVEDEWPARNYLVELLQATEMAEVVGAVASADEARQALRAGGIGADVAFVDVQLAAEGADAGLALVRSLAKSEDAPIFVLATAHKQHALEAFDLGIVDYVLKPFTRDRIEHCLKRIARFAPQPTTPRAVPRRIVARRQKSIVFLEPDAVWAFEASDRLTSVHTAEGAFDIDLTLASIEGSFGRALMRVHRNWLVNPDHVKELERDGNDTRLVVGAAAQPDRPPLHVPVARERATAVRDALLEGTTGLRAVRPRT